MKTKNFKPWAVVLPFFFLQFAFADSPVGQAIQHHHPLSSIPYDGGTGYDRENLSSWQGNANHPCTLDDCAGVAGPLSVRVKSESSDDRIGIGFTRFHLGINNYSGHSDGSALIYIEMKSKGTCSAGGFGVTEYRVSDTVTSFQSTGLATQSGDLTAVCTSPIRVISADGGNFSDVTYTLVGIQVDNQNMPPQDSACAGGSIIGIDGRTLGETIPIVGTNFSLYYSTRNSREYLPAYQIHKMLISDSTSRTISTSIALAGRVITGSVSAAPGDYFDYTWDGLDNLGSSFNEPQVATFTGENGSDLNDVVNFTQTYPLGVYRPAKYGMPGWTVSVHHYYNKLTGQLFLGTADVEQHDFKITLSGTTLVVSTDGTEVYEFDSSGKHLETKTSLTGSTKYSFGYDGSSRLTSITDAYGNVTTLGRSGGVLTSITGPYGQATTVSVNSSGLISSFTNPNSEVYSMTYKAGTELLETFTKPGLQTSSFTYDTDGTLIKDLGAGGNFWTLFKDVLTVSQPIVKTSQMGRQSTYVTTRDIDGTFHRVETEANGLVTTHVEGVGSKTFNDYGYVGNSIIDDERFTGFYNRVQQTVNNINTIGSTVIRTQSIAGLTDYFSYSSITKTFENASRITTEVFDAASKTFTTTTPEGQVSTRTIDSYEKPVSSKLGSDTPWTFSYDTHGRISQSKQSTRYQTDFTYNTDGTLQKTRNALTQETSYTYDASGRVATVTYPDLRVLTYAYDANGNVTGITPPSKPQHAFAFNLFELPSTYSPPTAGFTPKNTTYAYNLDKQITLLTRPDSKTAAYSYNATTGLLSSITTAEGSYDASYYANSKLQNFGSPYGIKSTYGYFGPYIGSEEQRRRSDNYLFAQVTWSYNSDHVPYIRNIYDHAGAPGTEIDYTYDKDLHPVTVGSLALTYSYPSGRLATTSIGQISDARTYDSFGSLASYTASYTDSSTSIVRTLYSYSFTRDALGRITQKVELIGGKTTTYDYDYDTSGRLTEVRRNTITDSHFNYDDNGNRTSGMTLGGSFTASFDNQDRLNSIDTKTYNYSQNGDVTAIHYSSSLSSLFSYDVFGNLKQYTDTSGQAFDYIMDAQNRRVGKKDSTGTVLFRYLYEGDYRIAAQLTGAGFIQKEFVYIPGNQSPDYMIDSGNTYRIIKDHLGSPRLIVNVLNGTIAERLDYSEIGTIMWDTNSCFQPFGFAGGIYDNNSKIYRFGARDYDPRSLGRWLSKDPSLFAGGDSNFYVYSLNDPINLFDPTGKEAQESRGEHATTFGINVYNTFCTVSGTCAGLPLPPPNLAQQLGALTGPKPPEPSPAPTAKPSACNPNRECCHGIPIPLY